MKFIVKTFIGIFLCWLMFQPSASAVEYDNKLVTLSVAPDKDKIELGRAKRRLDSIRLAENRPTVALVLCGGGAKGASQIGVMKVIEELDIPIDFICGTSIGGLLGGFFAMGYDSEFVGNIMKNADWGRMLTDKIDQDNYPLTTRKYKSRYQLSFPFHYEDNEHLGVDGKDKVYHETDGKLHFSDRKGDLTTKSGIAALASSLPSGLAFGLNVNNLLSSVSVGYQDSISFASLPVAFYCVATEMVSCKTKYWGSGDLKKAMRSTMSIPGLFTPVRTQGLVLCDGGSRDNFPTDIAKAAGADIIIGVDLTDPYLTTATLNNVGTIMGQYFNILGRESYENTRPLADVYIHPNLDGFGMMSFETAAVDSMIQRGYKAGMEHYDELLAVKKKVGGRMKLNGRPAVDINTKSVLLSDISFTGISQNAAKVMMKKIGLVEGLAVTAADLEKAVAIIQGTGSVESVTYSLHGTEEPYNLEFDCVTKPTDRFGLGLRFDSEIWADLALNYGWNVNKLFGPKLDIHGRLGISQSLYAKFTLDFGLPAINIDASISNHNVNFKSAPSLGDFNLDLSFWMHEEKIFFSLDDYLNFYFNAGFRNRYYNILSTSSGVLSNYKECSSGNYFGVFANFSYNTFDQPYFPNSGMDVHMDVACDFTRPGTDTYSPIVTEAFDIKGVIPFCDFIALIPDFHLRWVQDKYIDYSDAAENTVREFSLFHRNFFGGTIPGRYIEHQIPFCGMDHIAIATLNDTPDSFNTCDDIAVLNLDLRFNVARNWYVSGMGGYVHMARDLRNFFTYNHIHDIFGAAVQGSYNTLFGPISVRFNWCNRTGVFKNDWGVYISAGFDF